MELNYTETKKLLALVRRDLRDQEDKVWPLFRTTGLLKTLEEKLLEWYNNGAKD